MTERMHAIERRTGVVEAFDGESGLGTIVDDTAVRYPFHCVEVADGTRTIKVGTSVGFTVSSRFGRREATAIIG
ncbi:MAG: hypothetical protein AAGF73_07670 [Actinomycetota bacterium]